MDLSLSHSQSGGVRDIHRIPWLSSPPLLMLSRDQEICPVQKKLLFKSQYFLLVLALDNRKVMDGAVHEAGVSLADGESWGVISTVVKWK